MPENRLRKNMKTLYAMMNDHQSDVLGYKIYITDEKIKYRFYLSSKEKIRRNGYQILFNHDEVLNLLNMHHNTAISLMYNKIHNLITDDTVLGGKYVS